MKPLHVLFGTIDPGMPGGIGATEYAFQQACEETGRLVASRMPFGRRSTGGSTLTRLIEWMTDLVEYARQVRQERPDLVHLNTAFDRRALVRDLGYVVVSRLLRQPVFLKFHGSDADLLRAPNPFWRGMTGAVVGGASGIGVLSSEEKANFVAAGWPEASFAVVKNAVDCERFAGERGPEPDIPNLLFIARFVPAKGLSDTIHAVHALAAQGRRLTLTCVGDGPAKADAEALVHELGLEDTVRFTGRVSEEDTVAFYLRATLLVFPTAHGEGFSMTIFQALAAGLPILTTRIRAAADWLAEPDHCLWVPAHRPDVLADRIGWLLDHPDIARRMSATNRTYAGAFDAPTVATEYLDLYDAVVRLATRGTPASGKTP